MSATVLSFPVQVETVCDSCHRPTHEDDLSSFSCCDARVCRTCHECDCDRLAADFASRRVEAFWRKLRVLLWIGS
jgi:hypothetical protein